MYITKSSKGFDSLKYNFEKLFINTAYNGYLKEDNGSFVVYLFLTDSVVSVLPIITMSIPQSDITSKELLAILFDKYPELSL